MGSYQAVMDMPLSAFWEISRNIARLNAAADKRMFLNLSAAIGAAFSSKQSKYPAALDKLIGNVIKTVPVPKAGEDEYEAGYRLLRQLIGEQSGKRR